MLWEYKSAHLADGKLMVEFVGDNQPYTMVETYQWGVDTDWLAFKENARFQIRVKLAVLNGEGMDVSEEFRV